jgi:hypothetical protein
MSLSQRRLASSFFFVASSVDSRAYRRHVEPTRPQVPPHLQRVLRRVAVPPSRVLACASRCGASHCERSRSFHQRADAEDDSEPNDGTNDDHTTRPNTSRWTTTPHTRSDARCSVVDAPASPMGQSRARPHDTELPAHSLELECISAHAKREPCATTDSDATHAGPSAFHVILHRCRWSAGAVDLGAHRAARPRRARFGHDRWRRSEAGPKTVRSC